ncbi:MAG: hypothetical protein QOI48_1496 [Solirubrobacteraceae bacterium]|jgi:diguanylate cyclase (GGDEF)-like protein|nr:hypothetical protein [Solirubrobacteraceae bacterium]
MPDEPHDDAFDNHVRVPRPPPSSANDPGASEHDHRAAHLTPSKTAVLGGDESSLAESEQTFSDADQTLSDADQTGSDSDQTSADSDQWAADRDQAASDRDLAAGVNSRAHGFSRDVRQRTARQRAQSAHARLDAAQQRDEIAQSRDLAAFTRDEVAGARDLAMAARDVTYAQAEGARAISGADIVVRAARQRKRAAEHRAQVAEQRALAAEDRRAAANDREQAARERLRALVDREALARELAVLAIDPLTGARTRAAGLIELDHELERCRRTSGLLVVAYIDVVALKRLNDSVGHGAGDELLKRVVAHIKEHLRPYDLIIRLGGDEFLCAMSNMTLPGARQRLHAIAADLATAPGCGAIRTGFAQLLTPTETASALIARADNDLLATRRTNTNGSHPDRNSDSKSQQ